jgi:ABC-type multidrug transport system fused ATPase/permease subunit
VESAHAPSLAVAARNARRALALVFTTSPALLFTLASLTVVAGILPATATFVSKWIVDGVLTAVASGLDADRNQVVQVVALEGAIIASLLVTNRTLLLARSMLFARLGYVVSKTILNKAATLSLTQLEDNETVELMTHARRDATSRPFSLVNRVLVALEKTISLAMISGLLIGFSPWAALILLVVMVPALLLEGQHSGKRYRFVRGKTPEARERAYYEAMLTSPRFAKEMIPSGMTPHTLARYSELFDRLHDEDQVLNLRRSVTNIFLGVAGAAAFYGVYVWIVLRAVSGEISLGEMAMYAGLFRQGQKGIEALLATAAGSYEDILYLEDVHRFLDMTGLRRVVGVTEGADPGNGIRFRNVRFTYPGRKKPAVLVDELNVEPGERIAIVGANGSGKSTLIRLMLGLTDPDEGAVTVDGTDTRQWSNRGLGQRFGTIFQGFVKYELTVRDNIGASDADALGDDARVVRAGERGLATELIDELPDGLDTQLGKSRRDGTELSGGQWQRLALSRAFFPPGARTLVLDEPTSALDARGEADLFKHVLDEANEYGVVLVTHRLANARLADRVIVMSDGRITETGTHDELVAAGGRYAELYRLQAAGYKEG